MSVSITEEINSKANMVAVDNWEIIVKRNSKETKVFDYQRSKTMSVVVGQDFKKIIKIRMAMFEWSKHTHNVNLKRNQKLGRVM